MVCYVEATIERGLKVIPLPVNAILESYVCQNFDCHIDHFQINRMPGHPKCCNKSGRMPLATWLQFLGDPMRYAPDANPAKTQKPQAPTVPSSSSVHKEVHY
uniref:Uncharacterized protein n=1 Tax=Romanomermis culicivorax TaxID=13658 RepID=A0A915J8U9_ROMCU